MSSEKGKCRCIKDIDKHDIKVGEVLAFRYCDEEIFVYMKGVIWGVLICKEEYFNEHFEIIKQPKQDMKGAE